MFFSMYPALPSAIFFKIFPLLSDIIEMPEFADLKSGTPFSTDLKIAAVKCCFGPVVFPNQASFVILISSFIIHCSVL